MLLQSCSGSLYCQIKTQGAVSWSEFLTCRKSQSTLPRCFMCNWRSKENGDSEVPPPRKKTCCCWQVCERSGARDEAIKSSVRGHAKHDGKLQQWEEPSSRPVLLFMRRPPPPPPRHHHHCLASASRQTVPNTPPPLFTHPSEANRLQRSSSFKAGGISGTDKQPRDNPTEFSLSSWVPLPVCLSVHTRKKAPQAALEVCTLRLRSFIDYFAWSPAPDLRTTSVCERRSWQAFNTSTGITQDNNAILFDLWKANYWPNIDPQLLCDINLRSSRLESMWAAERWTRTRTQRTVGKQKAEYLRRSHPARISQYFWVFFGKKKRTKSEWLKRISRLDRYECITGSTVRCKDEGAQCRQSAISPQVQGDAEATTSRPPILQTYGPALGHCVRTCVCAGRETERESEGRRHSCQPHRVAPGLSG